MNIILNTDTIRNENCMISHHFLKVFSERKVALLIFIMLLTRSKL